MGIIERGIAVGVLMYLPQGGVIFVGNTEYGTLRQGRSSQQREQNDYEWKKGDDCTDCKHADLLLTFD